jgi:VanZ family protein
MPARRLRSLPPKTAARRSATPRQRSSATPLAWLYAALIVYASLYPFDGWRVPGVSPTAFLLLPWPRWWTAFDLVSNLLGYIPFGALVFGALVRSGWRLPLALGAAIVTGSLLSLAMETLQNYLPQRVSSNVDLGLNSLGSAIGALLGLVVHRLGGIERWQGARDRWFVRRSAGGLALLVMWPVALLFPTPVPLAMGQILGLLRQILLAVFEGTPAEDWAVGWLDTDPPWEALHPLSMPSEISLIALGLLAPCMVAFTISQRGWRRLVLVAAALILGCATTTLSTALNFGPQHALAWNTAEAWVALGVGSIAAALLTPVPRRVAASLGLIVLTALAMLVAKAPADPYFAQSLRGWEQGRFIRFHGAAQWVGWLWPYAAAAYLLSSVAARDEAPPKMPA